MALGVEETHAEMCSADVDCEHIAHLVGILLRFCSVRDAPHATCICPSVSLVPLQVAMDDFGLETFFIQKITDMLGQRHRSMPSAGAADGNRKVTLALADIVRQQEQEQVRNAADKFAGQ